MTTPDLDQWLQQATRSLSKDSAAQVRAEIQEHYDSTREAAISAGASTAEADRSALSALGDARTANRQYHRVLLTASEARLLGQGNWEARLLCSSYLSRWVVSALSLAALVAAGALFLTGWTAPGRVALAIGIGSGFMCVTPFLPVYTPSRARIYRCVRWVVQVGLWVLAFGPGALRMSWLLILCLWQLTWVEWRRAVIRRKLPVSQWPRQLYL